MIGGMQPTYRDEGWGRRGENTLVTRTNEAVSAVPARRISACTGTAKLMRQHCQQHSKDNRTESTVKHWPCRSDMLRGLWVFVDPLQDK